MGIATEYVVILILIALAAVLVLANYGRNVGNQVGAAGGKIGTLGEAGVEGTGASGGGAASGVAARPEENGAATSGRGPQGGGPSGRKDGRGQPLPETAADAARPSPDAGTSRQIVIGGIILAAVGLLVAVRFSQSMRRMGEERQKQAQKALREEADRDVDEDTLNVKRSEIFGHEEEGGEER